MADGDFSQLSNGGGSNDPVNPQYSKLSESLRRVAPPHLQCSIFCGGRRCKYESGKFWPDDAKAVKGLYSHWVTEDVLAMARINKKLMKDVDILGQFNKLEIKSVINLQVQGEHSSCSPNEMDPTGFAYDPQELMDNGIYFYNFAWRDYGETSIALILDMVKVVSFGISMGKVAIHCHAGLGRTGVLISCYLVYSHRLRANEAMRFVRLRRPGSVQSRLQILSVQQFEQYILPHTIVFCNRDLLKDKKLQDFTLAQYLKRQKFLSHGRETKTLRFIPKILYVTCERLLWLCGRKCVISSVEDEGEEAKWKAVEVAVNEVADKRNKKDQKVVKSPSPSPSPSLGTTRSDDTTLSTSCYTPDEVVRALLYDHVSQNDGLSKFIRQIRLDLNQKGPGAWHRLSHERNLYVLTALMFFWLEHLRTPILGDDELTIIVLHADTNPSEVLRRLPQESSATLDYLLRFVGHLDPVTTSPDPENPEPLREMVLKRFGVALTHRILMGINQGFHTVIDRTGEKPKPRKLNEGTLRKLMTFLERKLGEIVKEIDEEYQN